jgi:MSHA biogenesis protein MshJ
MINKMASLQRWAKRIYDPKRRLQFFLISLPVIYFIWFFIFLNPVLVNKYELRNKIQALQLQITQIEQQIHLIEETVKTESVMQDLAEQARLAKKIQYLQQVLAKTHLYLISMQEWIQLKKAIISQQNDMDRNITLVSLNNQPVQQWMPAAVDKIDVMNVAAYPVYQHVLEIKFQSDYFSTIQYMSRLEKLPWAVYWDNLDYKVLTYPKAEVTIKFHIFSREQRES